MDHGQILASGRTSFKIDVPYQLIETGNSTDKPLIVYLHGFNQNLETFQNKVETLLSIQAYHLFIQAPYPIYDLRGTTKQVKDWGRAWYLYDGKQDQFMKSMEIASEFIQDVIDRVFNQISVNRLAVLGYSMGGYLAGYYALSRPKHINDLIVIGGRIKTEIVENKQGMYDHLNVLALHGKEDESVKSEPQKKSCQKLSEWGANVTFKELNESHALSNLYLNYAENWLITQGYKHS